MTALTHVKVALLVSLTCSGLFTAAQNRLPANLDAGPPVARGTNRAGLYSSLVDQMRIPLRLKDLTEPDAEPIIRVWYDYSLMTIKELFEFRLDDGRWSGKYYYFTVNRDSENYLYTLNSSYVQDLAPKHGWPDFASTLEQIQVVDLRAIDSTLTAQRQILDGTLYSLEINNRQGYRRYEYHCPEYFPESADALRFVALLDYLDVGFGVKTIRDKPGVWAQWRRWRKLNQ